MLMAVPFLQKRGTSFRYRRKVPEHLRDILGKREIAIPLGKSEQEALKHYAKAHAQAEKLLATAGLPQPTQTALDHFRAAQSQIEEWGMDPEWAGEGDPDSPEDDEAFARSVTAEGIAAKYREYQSGAQQEFSPRDKALIQSLMSGSRAPRPAPTLEDARRLYAEEKINGDKKKTQQLENIFKLIAPVVKLNRPLAELRRADAKNIRDCLLDGRKPQSAQRYLNTVRSLVNHAIREYELTGVTNPFDSLPVSKKEDATPDKTKRDAFTEVELNSTRARVLSMARDDVQLIWRILENTGCRPAEVSGLRVEDVLLNHPIPHIVVEWHDARRIKTLSSRRKVPLLGDALEAAKEAVNAAGDGPGLFSAYFREGGADSLSAALGRHVRACVARKEVVTYSLRHRIDSRLEVAKVQSYTIDRIMGHTSGKIGEVYGGEYADLLRAKEALEAALSPEITAQLKKVQPDAH